MVDIPIPRRSTKRRRPNEQRFATVRASTRWTSALWDISLWPLVIFLIVAVPGRWIVPGDPTTQDLLGRLTPPVFLGGDWDHPLGTDGLGRDVLARINAGAGLSLRIGLLAAAASAAIGITIGLVAGSIGGPVDVVATSIAELGLAIPTIVVGIVLTATLGQSLSNLLVILVFSGWISYARIIRLQCRQLVRSEFVQASYAIGARWPWIISRHLLPNIRTVAIVLVCQQIAAVMLWEASLTYLGLGLPIERISLGGMIKDGQVQIFDAWWVSLFPGVAIALAVFGFNLAADRLHSMLDPELR